MIFSKSKLNIMYIVKRIWYFIILIPVLFASCEDPEINAQEPDEVLQFFKQVQRNPLMVGGIALGDSWRLTREEASYHDGDYVKEFEYDLLNDPEHNKYKEYWIFDEEKLLRVFEGERFGKNWDGYHEFSHQQTDLSNKKLTVDYVYDGGAKTYTRYWTITKLTETELILTDESFDEEYFYQVTFRREKFGQ
jgi:hypothetical protein